MASTAFAATPVLAARTVRPAVRRAQVAVRAQAPKVELPAVAKPAALVAVANAIMAAPASAEAGKLFDFGLTLPIMASEFLLLMVFLDKFWFGPVGAVLDERDEIIRSKLASVKGDTSELAELAAQAESAVKDARAEAQENVASVKASTQAAQNEKIAALKAKVDSELASAMKTLDSERDSAMSNLDSQVDKLSAEILARVLPESVKVA